MFGNCIGANGAAPPLPNMMRWSNQTSIRNEILPNVIMIEDLNCLCVRGTDCAHCAQNGHRRDNSLRIVCLCVSFDLSVDRLVAFYLAHCAHFARLIQCMDMVAAIWNADHCNSVVVVFVYFFFDGLTFEHLLVTIKMEKHLLFMSFVSLKEHTA